MNLALETYADNPIIDELVYWPPNPQKIKSIRGSFPIFRKPFIEIEYIGGDNEHAHFAKEGFAEHWAEAIVILETITDIQIISDFPFKAIEKPQNLANRVIATRKESIEEGNKMFEQGMYRTFINQFGLNCKNLPLETMQALAEARKKLKENE